MVSAYRHTQLLATSLQGKSQARAFLCVYVKIVQRATPYTPIEEWE
jgi:hypothetical protein